MVLCRSMSATRLRTVEWPVGIFHWLYGLRVLSAGQLTASQASRLSGRLCTPLRVPDVALVAVVNLCRAGGHRVLRSLLPSGKNNLHLPHRKHESPLDQLYQGARKPVLPRSLMRYDVPRSQMDAGLNCRKRRASIHTEPHRRSHERCSAGDQGYPFTGAIVSRGLFLSLPPQSVYPGRRDSCALKTSSSRPHKRVQKQATSRATHLLVVRGPCGEGQRRTIRAPAAGGDMGEGRWLRDEGWRWMRLKRRL